jgi:hypothetical protein
MLADQLLAPNPELDDMTFNRMYVYQDVLRRAEKFVIDRSIGEVAGDMPRQAVRDALPFCRLPYPTCWLEIAQQDRPFFADAFLHGPNHSGVKTYQPLRVGILCEQQGDNPQRFWATLAWTYAAADQVMQGLQSPVSICPMGLSIWCDEADPEFGEPFTIKVMVAPYWRETMMLFAEKAPGLLPMLKRNADHDWAGEPWFWFAVMALLNAKNGASSTFTPAPPKLNKARVKAGKPPLADFHQLTLRIGPRDAQEGRGGASGHDAMRAHTVRGHFKIRKTGIYWWRPFIRGDVTSGFAGKRYKVKL